MLLIQTREKLETEFSPSKKVVFICFNENPVKITENDFYSILKAPFVIKISKLFS